MRSVTVLAPAKLNLTLDVTGTRPDGYHTLDMIMQAVSLRERVTLRRSRGLSLSLPGSRVPANEHNTAYKAALAFFHGTGLLAGAAITVEKHVPVRAGMAGGSADAAAVLVGLNELYGARLSAAELCALGAQVGADVPFSIVGGTARVTGVGDILEPLKPCPPCFFTVCMPAGGISTPQAYARYDRIGTDVRPDSAAASAAIARGDLAGLCAQMKNALEYSSASAATNAARIPFFIRPLFIEVILHSPEPFDRLRIAVREETALLHVERGDPYHILRRPARDAAPADGPPHGAFVHIGGGRVD